MSFLDFLGPIGTAVGGFFGGGPGAAIGGAVGGLFGDDDIEDSMPSSGSSFGFDSILGGLKALGSTGSDLLGSFGLSGKDLFSAASATVPYMLTKDAQDRANEMNIGEAEKSRQFGREMWGKQYDANFAMARETNAFNEHMYDRNLENNRRMAGEQMDFQRDMASTQWQRAVKDMEDAGLSPMLAYSKGGNAAGSGVGGYTSAPSGSNPSTGLASAGQARVESGVPAAFQSAYQMSMMGGQVDNLRAQNELLRAQTESTVAEKALRSITFNKVQQEIDNLVEHKKLTQEQARRVEYEIVRMVRAGNYDAVRSALLELEIPEAAVKARAILSESGEKGVRGYYAPYLRDIGSMIHSATEGARMGRYFGR